MAQVFSLNDLIPDRTGKPWEKLAERGSLTKLKWSKKIHSIISKKNIKVLKPLRVRDLGGGDLFSFESETSITFPNKDLHPFFYQPNKIITIYNDNLADSEPVGSSKKEQDYKKFIVPLLSDPEPDSEVSRADKIYEDLLLLNKLYDYEGNHEKYYKDLKRELLSIIENTNDINLIITLLPKNYYTNKETILVGNNFNTSNNTIGLNIYSEKYYEKTSADTPENLQIYLLTLLEQISEAKAPYFNLDFNLKNINELLKGKIVMAASKDMDTKSTETTIVKNIDIELCNGEKIQDNYFSDWVKIEIDQIKNKNFNTFLVEPETTKKTRKLLSYSKNDKKPSRFAGYFRQLDDTDCEIIWDVNWEIKHILEDDATSLLENVPESSETISSSKSFIVHPNKIQDTYYSQIGKLNKLIKFEKEITENIGDYKLYNIEGNQGNCFFYSFANSLIELGIINFKEEYPDLIGIVQFEKLQNEDRIRPLYKGLGDQLRILAHDILKNTFDKLNNSIKTKITADNFDGITYPTDEITDNQEALQELFNQRISIVEGKVRDELVGLEREDEIKIYTDSYLQKLKSNKFWGSNLEFEALCAFFNTNGEILTIGKQSKLIRTNIDKGKALVKFSLEGIMLANLIAPLSPEESSDKIIYLSLIDNHFISTIPWESFAQTSYNYLFQNDELEVSINYPKGTYNKMKISDFHIDDDTSIVSDTFLEKCHNYIQWLFPNMRVSEQVQGAQRHIYWNNKGPFEVPNQLILNSDDVKFLRKISDGDQAKINSIKSLMRIMKFYGFHFMLRTTEGARNLELTTYPNFEKQLKNINLERLDIGEYEDRFANLLSNTHNYSRITRILKYLNVIGLSKLSAIIVNKLEDEIDGVDGELKENSEIKRSLHTFWKNISNN